MRSKIVNQPGYSGTELSLPAPAGSPPASPTPPSRKSSPGWTQTPRSSSASTVCSSGCKRRNAQHGVPAALDLQPLDRRQPRQLPVQFGQVGRHALPNLPLDRRAACEPRRQRALHRRIHREKGVGDDLQPVQRLRSASGPVATIQAAFICGSPAILLSPLTTKTGTPSSPAAKLVAAAARSRSPETPRPQSAKDRTPGTAAPAPRPPRAW